MNECYAVRPREVEVFSHGGGSDIILRKNIQPGTDEEGRERWECEERQMRCVPAVSFDDVQTQFDKYWEMAGADVKTTASAKNIRTQRNQLLLECDWTQVLDAPIDEATREAYRAYRQELRDITEQPGFPENVIWPKKPETVKASPDPVDAAFDALIGGKENA